MGVISTERGPPAHSFTARVLEAVIEELGFDEIGYGMLCIDHDGAHVRRWGPYPPRNGADGLARFDAGLRARLADLLASA